jgi:hypothetical protein
MTRANRRIGARDTLERYLREADPYDEIHLGLFSHGTCSIGRARIEDWNTILGHARRHGAYCGVDTDAYPLDFASNGRFHRAANALPTAPVQPGTAPWDWVRGWLHAHDHAAAHYTSVR